MTNRQKLEIIQRILGLTQTQLADKFDVTFVALNSWWNEKSTPRPKMQLAIDELYLEVTGQKTIPASQLIAKKQLLIKKSKEHKSVISEIFGNQDICDEFILKLTYHSDSIEGSSLSEPDTKAILFDNIALPYKSMLEQLGAKNHQTALNYLFNHIAKKKGIDEDLVLKLHAILMNGIRSDAGGYRRHAVRIVGVNLPTANYPKVPGLIPEIISDIRIRSHDIINQVAGIHAKFEQVHPFSDGNGRVGRLLMNGMLLKENIAPAIIRQERKQLYYTYLNMAQTKDDSSQLEGYLCDAIMDGFMVLERHDIK